MQISVDKLKYKNLKNISFNIEKNIITGIICNNISDLIDLTYCLSNDIKDSGKIKYSSRIPVKKIKTISLNMIFEMVNGKVKDVVDLESVNNNYYDLIKLDESYNERLLSTLSTTEKIKLLILKELNSDFDTFILTGILEELDFNMRKLIIKLIINLKKFEGKTIIVLSTDIDIVYEFIDSLVLIIDNKCYYSENKYLLFNNKNIINNPSIKIPFCKKIENKVYEKSNINLGNNDSINELIKSIYRELR